jgi:D-alanine-D-alanine ligase
MNILVLNGGDSPERAVSLRSGEAVAQAARKLGHHVTQLDPHDDAAQLPAALAAAELVLPILHGAGGEDGQIQDQLEAAGVAYLGSRPAASRLCFDKPAFKALLRRHRLPTPAAAIVDAASLATSPLAQQPFVLKPADGGSSVDTFIVRDPTHLPAGLAAAFGRYPTMLLEELIEGTEATVAVLDNTALPVVEIIPPQGQEFDYTNKYNGATAELCPPQHITPADQRLAQQLAEAAHRLASCRHLSRTDIMITPDHHLFILETNTLPGLTAQSLFPKAAAAAGLDWPALVARFIELARSN